jgi:hypothetical protein
MNPIFRGLHPFPPDRGDAPENSPYYWWWAYLRENSGYLECCARNGESLSGRMAEVFRDFGDVRDSDFTKWWHYHDRGTRLFAERPSALTVKRMKSLQQCAAALKDADVAVLAVSLACRKNVLMREFQQLLAEINPSKPGRPALSGSETSTARYPLAQNPNVMALARTLEIYRAVNRNRKRRKPLPDYLIGCRYNVLGDGTPPVRKAAEDTQLRARVEAKLIRFYLRGIALVTNAALGLFPKPHGVPASFK